MSIFRKDDLDAMKRLDEDLKIIEKKVNRCDASVTLDFLGYGSRYMMHERDKELKYETASDYFAKARKLSDRFESKCNCI